MEIQVKKYRLVYIDLVLAVVSVVVATYFFTPVIVSREYLWFIVPAFFLVFALIHELSHLIVAQVYNPDASVRLFPKLGALLLDYVSLPYEGYLYTVIAPLLVVQIPLIITYLFTGNPYILAMNVFHLAASSVDITGILYSTINHGVDGRLYLVYDEKCCVVGVLIEEPKKNSATLYSL